MNSQQPNEIQPQVQGEPLAPSFWSIWKLLGSIEDWERVPDSLFSDSIQHKVYDLRFYTDNGGIAFHNKGFATIYWCNPFNFIFMAFRTRKFAKAFPGNRIEVRAQSLRSPEVTP